MSCNGYRILKLSFSLYCNVFFLCACNVAAAENAKLSDVAAENAKRRNIRQERASAMSKNSFLVKINDIVQKLTTPAADESMDDHDHFAASLAIRLRKLEQRKGGYTSSLARVKI